MRLYALVALERFEATQAELQALGDLRRPALRHETYGGAFGAAHGSVVPLQLLLVAAMMPALIGKQHVVALGNLFELLNDRTHASDRVIVMTSIVRVLLQMKEYSAAIEMIGRIRKEAHFMHSGVLLEIGCIVMSSGNAKLAHEVFSALVDECDRTQQSSAIKYHMAL